MQWKAERILPTIMLVPHSGTGLQSAAHQTSTLTITPVAPCYLTLLSHLETQGVQSLYELGLCAHDVQQGEHVIDVHVH